MQNRYTFTIPIFILAFLGFLDTVYLTIIHYKNIIPPCSIAHGCETVLTSRFSTIFGIPIQIPGILFYLTLLVLFILFMQTQRKVFYTFSFFFIIAGLVVSIVLFSIQAFILHAFCQYCLASEIIILLLFFIAWMHWRRLKGMTQGESEELRDMD